MTASMVEIGGTAAGPDRRRIQIDPVVGSIVGHSPVGPHPRGFAAFEPGPALWREDTLARVGWSAATARLAALAAGGALIGAWWSMTVVGGTLWLTAAALTGEIDIVAGFWFVARFGVEFAPFALAVTTAVMACWLASAMRVERRVSAHRAALHQAIAAAAARP